MSLEHCWRQRPRTVVVAWILFLALFFHLAIISTDPPHLQNPRPIGMYASLQQPLGSFQPQQGIQEGHGTEGDTDSLLHLEEDQGPQEVEDVNESNVSEVRSEDVLRPKTKNYGSSVVVHLNTTWNSEVAAARREEYNRRLGRVKSICKTTKTFQRSLDAIYRTILWDKQDHLMWCPVLKAASTTWIKNFSQLAKSRDKVPHDGKKRPMRKKSRQIYKQPEDELSMLNSSLKFLIVRHPFKRLLSAYRDKMLAEKNSDGKFRDLQYNITKQYQKPLFKLHNRRKRRSKNNPNKMSKKAGNKNNKKYKHNEDVTPACEDLTPDYSTDDANITVFLNRHTDQGAEWIHPTFTQFLTRVRDDMLQMWQTGGECVINKHWRPYWVSCGPCQLDYNVIAKFETLDLDNEYIIQESNLQGKFTNMHTHSANSDGFKSTSEAIKHYFSEVPVELLREIVDLYDPDFQLFEYDPQPFLNLGKS